jgi:glycosyltransferase involved in cell wall biosynthesis
MKNVLIINQSAELYGADKVILELIENFPEGYNPIIVLHEEGPLKIILEDLNIQVIKTSVIKVKRGILKSSFFIKLPFEVLISFYNIRKELKGKKIDLIHSNATSVFIGAFYGFFFRIPHLWHVHEIIEKPKRIAQIYPHIISFFSKSIIYNSKASYNHFVEIKKSICKKSKVVYNGQNRNQPLLNSAERELFIQEHLGFNNSNIIIGLVGRINKWKGHILLLQTFCELLKIYPNIRLVFVGSPPPNQEFYLDDLNHLISNYKLAGKIKIIPFQNEIWNYYDALDISVVPSTEPEPFGLVATESMLSMKPVVAANHGGLSEIVVDNETGYFFKPNDSNDLYKQLEKLIIDKDLRTKFGENGLKRVKENFSTKQYVTNIEEIYLELTH